MTQTLQLRCVWCRSPLRRPGPRQTIAPKARWEMPMIGVRDVTPDDQDRILRWRNSEDVARAMYTDHAITPEEHAAWFARTLAEQGRPDGRTHYWIIELDGKPVGVVNLADIDRHNRRCSWAFYLADPATRGQGVGSWVERFVLRHVFETLRLEKLCCEVLEGNEAVVRLHERHGFTVEGRLRRHVYKAGRPYDVYALAILRQEWREREGAAPP
jgi:UDP-4-amino-4,6-dideoxy-N-acetyl-beta-L-altrosamine N-acetyltransferase